MEISYSLLVSVFLGAGIVKGVIGLGLPTIAMGLLVLAVPPADAATLLLLPSLVTNVWQMLIGGALKPLLKRLWPMLVGVCIGTWSAAGLLDGSDSRLATCILGFALVAYAIAGLHQYKLPVRQDREHILGPLVGAVTGIITAGTGVFVIPAVPYLQGIELRKDELVQALGLSFTVSTIALAANLHLGGAVKADLLVPTVLATASALMGVRIGQRLREELEPGAFRRYFFLALLALGAYVAARSLM